MKIKLPRNLAFDLDNIPEDFDEQIRNAFHDYTDGTSPAYMFHDKLAFIDQTLEYLHNTVHKDAYGTVKSLCLEQIEYRMNEYMTNFRILTITSALNSWKHAILLAETVTGFMMTMPALLKTAATMTRFIDC